MLQPAFRLSSSGFKRLSPKPPPNHPYKLKLELTIDAELLHHYAADENPYSNWLREVKDIGEGMRAFSGALRSKTSVTVNPDGRTVIDIELAIQLLLYFSNGLPSAIPLIAIAENNCACPPIVSIETELRKFSNLVTGNCVTDPKLLHEYLGIDTSFEPWIRKHIKRLGMQRDRGYFVCNGLITINDFEARRIALSERTKRAEQIRICISNISEHRAGSGCANEIFFQAVLSAMPQNPISQSTAYPQYTEFHP